VTLPAGTQVYICGQEKVEVGFSSKSWLRIAYMSTEKHWRYGWVLDDNLEKWRSKLDGGIEGVWPSMAAAFAAEPNDTKEQEQGNLPVAPPLQSDTSPSFSAARTAAWSDLGVLYAPLFVAMLLGMIAKTVLEYLDALLPKVNRASSSAHSGAFMRWHR